MFSTVRHCFAAIATIRTRVMLLVTLGAMPLAALLVAGTVLARRDVVQANRSRVLELARLGAEQQDGIIKEARTLLTVLSRLAATGKVNQANCFDLFEQIVADHPAVASLAMIDAHGLAGCISADPQVRLDISDRPFIQRLLRQGAAGFDMSELVFSRQTGLPAIFIGLPLPSSRVGRQPGLVVAGLNLDWFRNLSGTVGRGGASSSAVLLDARDGTILSSFPKLERNFLRPVLDGPVLTAYRSHPGQAGTAEGRGVDGVNRILGYAPLPGASNQIVVAVGLVRSEVLAQANRRVAVALGLVLAALTVAAGMAWLAAWLMMISPMAAFTRTASRLAAGDLLARVAMPRWQAPELRHLAATLNTMAARVSVAQATLGRNADQLQATNRELERLAVHLARARDRAEHASRAKSRFLAGMSHELRTPLNGILGYSQLLRDEGGLTPPQLARVEAMLGAGAHLLQMINRVLDMSEIEAEHVQLQDAALDLRALTGACLDLVRPAAEAKGLRLGLSVAADVPLRIVADGTRLRQVLLNLLGNAVKFTPAGGVDICLSMAGDGRLVLEVADTGLGIPAARQDRLFQDFERLGAEDAEGAGLGLAISVRLAKLMGGTLTHVDNPGGGSRFGLALPMRVPESESAACMASPPRPICGAAAPCETGSQAGPKQAMRLLVADDTPMNRDVARSFLQAAGHEVVCVEGGEEAVAAAASGDYDVVLMDVRMPRVDGLDATRRIRALPGPRGQVPIVALTAQAFAGQVAECLAAGMDTHLAKPYAPAALLDAVARAGARVRPAMGAAGTLPTQASTISLVLEKNKEPERDPDRCSYSMRSDDAPAPMKVLDNAVFDRTASFLQPGAVTAYLETIAQRCRMLREDLRTPDALRAGADAVADAAHALAGSAGMFGLERLAGAARRFEQQVQTGTDLRTCADELDVAMLEAEDRLLCLVREDDPVLL